MRGAGRGRDAAAGFSVKPLHRLPAQLRHAVADHAAATLALSRARTARSRRRSARRLDDAEWRLFALVESLVIPCEVVVFFGPGRRPTFTPMVVQDAARGLLLTHCDDAPSRAALRSRLLQQVRYRTEKPNPGCFTLVQRRGIEARAKWEDT